MTAIETDAGDLIQMIPIEARELLRKLASAWSDVADHEALVVVPLKVEEGTATNKVFEVKWKTNNLQGGKNGEVTHRKVLLRIYGEGMKQFFNREDEIRLFEAVSRQGQGPRLLGTFANGRVEEFVRGRNLSSKDLRDQKISAIIAKKLRAFHDLDIPGPKKVLLWERLRNWLNVAKRLSSPEEAEEFRLNMLEEEIFSLENELSSEDKRIGFCHNDLWYRNIMMDDETKQLTIIDYESAGFNPIAFDIANHFCAMATDFDHTDELLTLDYKRYPDFDERKRFVQIYLGSTVEDPKDKEVETLLRNIEKYALASHLWCGLWSIIIDHETDGGLGYIEFIRKIFRQYWLRKSEISEMLAKKPAAGVAMMDPTLIKMIPVEAREVLHGLASAWTDVADPEALEMVPLKGEEGKATNKVFEIKWKTNNLQDGQDGEVMHRKVLLRIYGEGMKLFFDREDEIRTFEAVSRQGQGPKLLGTFANGRVEEFIQGRTLSAKDFHDPEISAIIATKLRKFHDLDIPGPKKVHLWDKLENWLKVAKMLSSPKEAKEFCLDKIEAEISSLEDEVSSEDQRIGFCHNDLWYGNLMMNEKTKQLTIIDYESASFNPVAFDIANHFCVMATNYHTTPHTIDHNRYPDLDERKRFVHIYLSSSGEDPRDEEVEILLHNIEQYVLASHLWFGLWALIADHVNETGLDYMDFVRQKFQMYWLRRSATLGSG